MSEGCMRVESTDGFAITIRQDGDVAWIGVAGDGDGDYPFLPYDLLDLINQEKEAQRRYDEASPVPFHKQLEAMSGPAIQA